MDALITWMHYVSTFFLSLGIILFARYLFSSVSLTQPQRETKVYLPAFGVFCLASVSESLSCYFADRVEDFHTTAALAVIPFALFVCLSVKSIRRKRIKREGDGNP